MGVDVAVVIVSYNSAHVIESLLDSLPAALDGVTADIVVVDNGSTDNTREAVRQRRDCRLVESSNVGYAAGINLGVQFAEGANAVLALNPDVHLERAAVRYLYEALALPGTGIVAPQIRNPDGSLYLSLRRQPTLPRALGLTRTKLACFSEYVHDIATYHQDHIVDWALGAVLLVSRECHDAVGGWDETYFLYSEETQLSTDAARLGYVTRYVPTAVATHIGGQSGTSNATHVMMVINRIRYYRRRHGLIASWCYLGLNLLSEVSWIIRGRRRSRFAALAILRPAFRPPELRCSQELLPR